MLAKTLGFAVHGVDARTILIEVNVAQGTSGSNFTPTVRGGLPPYVWATTGLPW